MERAYETYSFTTGYRRSLALFVFATAVSVSTQAILSSPPTDVRTAAFAVCGVVCICSRVYLHRATDQTRASCLFSQGWCFMICLFCVLCARGMPLSFVGPTPLSAASFLVIAFSHTTLAVVQCLVNVNREGRLLTICTAVVVRVLFCQTVSELGHTLESVINIAALLNGELLCHRGAPTDHPSCPLS